jgi:KipI family sensor histidine kinase inhibitor
MNTPPLAPRILDAGDCAVVVEFGDDIDAAVNARVLALDAAVGAARIPGVIETNPTYRSLFMLVDPLTFDRDAFRDRVVALSRSIEAPSRQGRRWRVPVVYGGDFGIDLEVVAALHGLTARQAVDIHAGALYRVFMIGFTPGYTYLGGLDPRLATPRRPDPRPLIPASSISIGGIQASVSAGPMPSGWHLLGRTPVRTFVPHREPAVLFAPGDELVFEPVEASRWDLLDARAEKGELIAEVIDP